MRLFNFNFKKIEAPQPGIRKFGWKKDLPDRRDMKFMVEAPVALPPLVDLRSQCPPVYDQGELGSCTANALAAAYEFEHLKQGLGDFIPSRLFIYYNERKLEGSINSDSGAAIRDGMKTLVSDGVCLESMWPYIISKYASKPSCGCYKTAIKDEVKQYLNLNNGSLADIKQCLAIGYPVVFGFIVYESFMTEQVARTGMMPMPGPNEQPEGGHAIMTAGYDDSKNALIIRNSWGTNWGLNGYFYMPYEYITTPDLADDFWTIRLVE